MPAASALVLLRAFLILTLIPTSSAGAAAEPVCSLAAARIPRYPPTVGTRKLYEDAASLVWEFVLGPGERLPPHEHMYDYKFTVIQGTRLAVFAGSSGEEMFQFDSPKGATMAFVRKGDKMHDVSGAIPPFDAIHGVQNVGNTTYHEILFETKPRACVSQEEAEDAGAQLYDNQRIKRIQMYHFQEEKRSGGIVVLLDHGKKVQSAAGDSAKTLSGSLANHESEIKFSKDMSHIMLIDFKNPSSLEKAVMAKEVVVDLTSIPTLVFDFHPNVVKTAKRDGVGSLKHVVLIKFKNTAPVGDLVQGYIGLTKKVEEMKGFEWGPCANNLNKNGNGDDGEVALANGFQFAFITTFEGPTARDSYLFDEAHQAYVEILVPHIADFMVFDFVGY